MTLTAPVDEIFADPEFDVAVHENFESKLVIETLNPVDVGVGVPNIGVSALPTLATPLTEEETVAVPAFEAVTVTEADWPAASPEIVIGRLDPEAVPFAEVPDEVVTVIEKVGSKLVTLKLKPVGVGVTIEKVGVNPLPRIAFPVTEPEPLKYPTREVVTETVALCPTVKPVTVRGIIEPLAVPGVTMPALVFITKLNALS